MKNNLKPLLLAIIIVVAVIAGVMELHYLIGAVAFSYTILIATISVFTWFLFQDLKIILNNQTNQESKSNEGKTTQD